MSANEMRKLLEAMQLNESEAARELEEIKAQIKELVSEAETLIRRNGSEITYERARKYWIPHILMALDDEHGYMGGSMVTMDDTIGELSDEGIAGDKEPVELGYEAHLSGEPQYANPFPEGSPARRDWDQGWRDAEFEN